MRTIKLLGLGISLHETKPLNTDPNTEIWGLQYTWQSHKLDRAFVMDEEGWIVAKNKTRNRDIVREINDLKIPVFVSKPWGGLENYQEYPLEEVVSYFHNLKHRVLTKTDRGEEYKEITGRYFLNSFAYMLAMAITQMPDRIELFGIDMANLDGRNPGETWEDEKNCVNYWVGVAVGRGIEVCISKDSKITKPSGDNPSLYGYEVSTHLKEIRDKVLNEGNELKKAISSDGEYKVLDLTKSDIKLHVFRKEDMPEAKSGDVVVPKAMPYAEIN